MNVYLGPNQSLMKNAYIGEYGRNLNNWQLSQTSSALSGTWWSGISMKEDGTKMYLSKGKYIYGYNLTSAFDISSYTQTSSLYNNSYTGSFESIRFTNDGTKLYTLHTGHIIQYNLSTARDLSTAVLYYDYSASGSSLRGIDFNQDGTKIYISSGGANNLYYATLSTARDLKTIGTINTATGGQALDNRWGDNGNIYVGQKGESASNLSFSYCSTPYNITTITNTVDKNIGVCNGTGVWFNESGTIGMLVGGGNSTNYIRKYILK